MQSSNDESHRLSTHENGILKDDDIVLVNQVAFGRKKIVKKKLSGYENFSRLLQQSCTFFVLFCGFWTCLNLASLVLCEDGFESLGFQVIAIHYTTICVTSIFSTALLKHFGTFKCLLFGALAYCTLILAFVFPATKYDHPDDEGTFFVSDAFIKTMLVLTAIISGFGASILWVANGNYISECAIEQTKGFFFGFFWVIYMLSQVCGSLIGAAILESGRRQEFLQLTMLGLALAAAVAFCCVRPPLILEAEG